MIKTTRKRPGPTVETLIEAATQHGEDSEPDHEVGDLQCYLRAMWKLLTPAQRAAYVALPEVIETMENATGESECLLDAECSASVSGDHYLIFIWGDVEPAIIGPFSTPEERDREALKIRTTKGDRYGIYMLDMIKGRPVPGTYSGAFFRNKKEQ